MRFSKAESSPTSLAFIESLCSTPWNPHGYANYLPRNYQLLVWHPLYNAFSMITLGFCSALTHSLLNAGKRVFAISMAMIWFQEGLRQKPGTMMALLSVCVGGVWYSWERKTKKASTRTRSGVLKWIVSIAILGNLYYVQHFDKKA